jgi:hypothetical protein
MDVWREMEVSGKMGVGREMEVWRDSADWRSPAKRRQEDREFRRQEAEVGHRPAGVVSPPRAFVS